MIFRTSRLVGYGLVPQRVSTMRNSDWFLTWPHAPPENEHDIEKSPCLIGDIFLVGGFKYFWVSPLLGEDFQFDWYFSNGLKPPSIFQVCFRGSEISACFFLDKKKMHLLSRQRHGGGAFPGISRSLAKVEGGKSWTWQMGVMIY